MLVAYDRRTLRAYQAHAAKAIANWGRYRAASAFLRRFVRRLPAGARVLDYGCGIGTDMAWMRRQGLRVEGVDGTPAFVEEAARRCPGATVRCRRFEAIRLRPRRYDGIWCNAALIHVPPEMLRRQLRMLGAAIVPGGLLGLTLAWGRARTFTRRDWIPDRFIAAYSKPQCLAVFRGWVVHEARVVTGDGRQGRWIKLLASPPSGC